MPTPPLTKNKSVRYAGYVRYSSERQDDGLGLQAQINAIEKYVAEQGGTLVKIYQDSAKSGTSTRGRDEFLSMRSDAGKGLFDVLVVHKFDRLARNLLDSRTTKMLLRRDYGISVVSATNEPSEETGGAMGALMETIMEAFAEWYSANLSAEVRKVRGVMLEQGKWYGPRPYGYVKGDDGILKPHPTEAPILRWLFETYAEGNIGFKKLSILANSKGYKTVAGRDWSKPTLKTMLKSRTYLGELRHQDTTFDSSRKRTYEAEIEWFPGKHEPLISVELFNRAQELMAARDHGLVLGVVQRETNNQYLLQGLAFCATCFEFHSADEVPDEIDQPSYGRMGTRTRYGTKTREEFRYYKCRKEAGHGNARVDHIDSQLIEFLLSDKLPEEWRNGAVSLIAQELDKQRAQQRTEEILSVIRQMDARWDLNMVLDRDEHIRQHHALQEELAKLKPLIDDSFQRAISLVNEFPKHWAACNGDFSAQRELIALLVDRVYIQDKNIAAIVLKPDYRFVFPEWPSAPRALPPPSQIQGGNGNGNGSKNEGHEGIHALQYPHRPPICEYYYRYAYKLRTSLS